MQPTPPFLLLALGLAALIVIATMPLVLFAWQAIGRSDSELSLRKVHIGDIPRAGGLAMMLGFGVVVLIGLAGVSSMSEVHELFSVSPLTGLLIGTAIVWLTGLCDDLLGVRARTKLALQVAAAGIAVLYGVHWEAVERLLGPSSAFLEPLVTLVFLVVVANAVNFMDGLDGLASSLSAIPLAVILIVFAGGTTATSMAYGWVAAAALGVTLAFLVFNRAPAKVFMGDSGAYLLGFLSAGLAIAVEPVRPRVALINASVPLLLVAVPLFDLVLAVVRRKIRGQPISSADSDHIHHRLLAGGLSPALAVRVIATAAAMFAALALANLQGVGGWWTLLGTFVACAVSAVLLGYHRLLARLPAFQQDGAWSWRDRRRQVMSVLAQLEHVTRVTGVSAEQWWFVVGPTVLDALSRIGIPRFEILENGQHVYAAGDGATAWGYLGMPLPGHECREVRLFLEVRLVSLQPEAVMVLEKALCALGQQRPGDRTSPVRPIVDIAA